MAVGTMARICLTRTHLRWYGELKEETWFPPKYLQLTSSELVKRLQILSDEHFLYYFKELGECICRNCLSEEQWQDQMLDAIEEKEAA